MATGDDCRAGAQKPLAFPGRFFLESPWTSSASSPVPVLISLRAPRRDPGSNVDELRREGVSTEELLAGFGEPLPPRQVGERVVAILSDPRYESGVALGLKGDIGIKPLDG